MFQAEDQKELLSRGFTRRHLARMASVISAGAALPFYNEATMAQTDMSSGRVKLPPDAVRISSNENPLGPSKEALEAIYKIAPMGGRYSPNGEQMTLVKTISEVEGVKPDYVSCFAGSSDPLHRAVCAFVSPSQSVVMGDPGYESAAGTASFIGAKVFRIPLKKDYSHDVKAMVAADPNAGIIYICNPNNPTGTLTSKEDIEWVMANKPKGSVLLLDEAYVHFSDATMGSYMVAQDKDVIVLRTFSKAYGMAGIRSGFALGRPDLLAKMRPFGTGFLPITAVAASIASLKAKGLVAERKKINAEVREDVFNFLEQKKYSYVPSVSNKFMLQTNRPGQEIAKALQEHKIYIGRVWKAWPTYVRVSIGTKEEMAKFKEALPKVMA
jgi:histidinol-phosphate aminotransferase